MDNITKETLEEELQRDLEELEGKAPLSEKKSRTVTKKIVSKTVPAKDGKKTLSSKKTASSKKKVSKKVSSKKKPSEDTVVTPLEESAPKPVVSDPSTTIPASEDNVTSWIPTIIIILILVAIIFIGGQYFRESTVPEIVLTYNGVDFSKDATHWRFQLVRNGITYNIPLRFSPLDVENISISGVLDPKFNKLSPIYITADPGIMEDEPRYLQLGSGELSFNIVQALGRPIEVACTSEDDTGSCAGRKIVSCDNNPEGLAVIQLKTGSPTGIELVDTCILLRGEGLDLLRPIDRLLYQWYGIIEP